MVEAARVRTHVGHRANASCQNDNYITGAALSGSWTARWGYRARHQQTPPNERCKARQERNRVAEPECALPRIFSALSGLV